MGGHTCLYVGMATRASCLRPSSSRRFRFLWFHGIDDGPLHHAGYLDRTRVCARRRVSRPECELTDTVLRTLECVLRTLHMCMHMCMCMHMHMHMSCYVPIFVVFTK